eukprot:TRINITY_DN63436_c0_g1_i1.p1 TRINITY_DN63436_c0_g1~~TRINITY_DN63436_c0_g1_i1.p1  ORF type:complete len:173 (+),score=13.88 TRINITY_DN63436_c0_g1_i1:1-519(+)
MTVALQSLIRKDDMPTSCRSPSEASHQEMAVDGGCNAHHTPTGQSMATSAGFGLLAFAVADRVWWLTLLGVCYQRPPLPLLLSSSLGKYLSRHASKAIGDHRLNRVCLFLDSKASQFAKSRIGLTIREKANLEPKRLALVLPQSIALYNLFLPFWLPTNGWLVSSLVISQLE